MKTLSVTHLKKVAFLSTCLTFSVALADCKNWELQVRDNITSEIKLYRYSLGDDKKIPLILKNAGCSIDIKEKDGITSGNIKCTLVVRSTISIFTSGGMCGKGLDTTAVLVVDEVTPKNINKQYILTMSSK